MGNQYTTEFFRVIYSKINTEQFSRDQSQRCRIYDWRRSLVIREAMPHLLGDDGPYVKIAHEDFEFIREIENIMRGRGVQFFDKFLKIHLLAPFFVAPQFRASNRNSPCVEIQPQVSN